MASHSSQKLGGSGVAATRAWQGLDLGTTQGRPRHDLWTKLRSFRTL